MNKSAEQGCAEAYTALAMHYDAKQDKQKAIEYYTKGAELGDADAQFLIGSSYLYGMDVEKDEQKAIYWLTLASEQDHESAYVELCKLKKQK